MSDKDIQLEASWKEHLQQEFEQEYMLSLKAFLLAEKQKGKVIYPPGNLMFEALNRVPLGQVRVVILGQDPYHGPNQAHGLSFSVPDGVKVPPSLKNIYKELVNDLGVEKGSSGNLSAWADQGVLLLNSVLSVEAGQAASHQGKGWEQFTDKVIAVLNEQGENLVFMLWGSYAQKKGAAIDAQKHLILKSVHPSPLSAHRGFLGCGHFSKANFYLKQQGFSEISW